MRWIMHPTRLVIILAVALTAAVPALRRELVWETSVLARSIRHWSEPDHAKYLSGEKLTIGAKPDDAAAALRAHPDDLQLRIAIGAGHEPPSDPVAAEAREDALRLAPQDPVVLSMVALAPLREGPALHAQRWEGLGGRRAERREKYPVVVRSGKAGQARNAWESPAPGEFRVELLTLQQIAAPMSALDRWAAADPDNAAPDALAASLLLGAERDAQALMRLERGAAKPVFTLYQPQVWGAMVHEAGLRGVPPAGAEATVFDLDLNEVYGALGRLASTAQGIGWDSFEDGDQVTAFRWWLATGRLGGMMLRRERERVVLRLVGSQVQHRGYQPVHQWEQTSPPGERRKGRYRRGDAYAALAASHGEDAARKIRRELSAGQDLRARLRAAFRGSGDGGMPPLYHALAARQVSLLLFAVLVATAATFLLVVWRLRDGAPRLTRRWRALFVGVAIAAPLGPVSAPAIAAAIGTLVARESKAWPQVWVAGWPSFLAICLAPSLGLAVLAAAGGWWMARKQRLPLRPGFAGALRRMLATAVAALAAVWVVATSVAVREGDIFAQRMQRAREVGELRMMEEVAGGRWR